MELGKAKAPMEVDEEQMGGASTMREQPLQANEKMRPNRAVAAQVRSIDRGEVLHSKRLYWIGRRTQDIILSTLAILVLWPLVLVCAILIVIDSPGAGPFFIQDRVGRDDRIFRFINLRCMDLVRRLYEILEQIGAYFCVIQTMNFRNVHFRHQNGLFPAVETG